MEQIVFAATRAFVSGQMMPGDAFPSVRRLAGDLKVHPNTAHKAVQQLVREGWLEVHSGKGTLVAQRVGRRNEEKLRLLGEGVEPLVVEARSAGVTLDELQRAIADCWAALNTSEPAE